MVAIDALRQEGDAMRNQREEKLVGLPLASQYPVLLYKQLLDCGSHELTCGRVDGKFKKV